MLWAAVQRLTREQLGRGIIALCSQLQQQVLPKSPLLPRARLPETSFPSTLHEAIEEARVLGCKESGCILTSFDMATRHSFIVARTNSSEARSVAAW